MIFISQENKKKNNETNPPQSANALMSIDILEASQHAVTLYAQHLHAHFEHICRIGNRAGHNAGNNSARDIDDNILLARRGSQPFQRVIRPKFNRPVCSLS